MVCFIMPLTNFGNFVKCEVISSSNNLNYLVLSNAIYYFILKSLGAEVLYMNMSAYNEGRLQSSFWIVDKQHVYIGSASLDWRSLGQVI